MRSVSAREANQQFARILGEAANGEEIVITRRGKPVAVLAPYRQPPLTPEQKAAIEELVQMMRRGLVHDGRRFTRDEMHER
jgi:prevent-host-death family protein